MKKVLIITASLRPNSNSGILADKFAKGAASADNEVEKISLINKEINFCRGCLSCQNNQSCIIDDDAIEITQKMLTADVIAFATPVYYYAMAGQLKTLLDRANSLFASDYTFRDIYLLATAAEAEQSAVEGTISDMNGWVSCFAKAELKCTIFGGGVTAAGEIKNSAAVLQEAYELGKNI